VIEPLRMELPVSQSIGFISFFTPKKVGLRDLNPVGF